MTTQQIQTAPLAELDARLVWLIGIVDAILNDTTNDDEGTLHRSSREISAISEEVDRRAMCDLCTVGV